MFNFYDFIVEGNSSSASHSLQNIIVSANLIQTTFSLRLVQDSLDFHYFLKYMTARGVREDLNVRPTAKVYIIRLQTKQILERHLIIADQAYTMAKLKEMSNDTLNLPAARDNLKLRIKEHSESE